jgi:hypothetical protein
VTRPKTSRDTVHSEIPRTARDLFTALDIDVPRKIHELTTPEA